MEEPRILVFACNWCAYAGADLAGVSRMEYPSNIRLIRTMCSGRLDPGFVLRAFEKGADGVLILGCHPGDCQYIEGNLKAEKRVKMLKSLLHGLGFDESRLRLRWVSASEGARFAALIREFVEDLKAKGPSVIRKEVQP
jgi:coenzyme F420-reducing hydrogenase delta subunit